MRSAMGGALPLAGPKMYQSLGPHWSATMLSLIEFALIPIPVVFYLYGHKIREKSAYAPTFPKPAAAEAEEPTQE